MQRSVMISTLLSLALAGCVHEAPSRQLLDARAAYAQALACGAATFAAPDLIAARDALNNAEIASREGAFEAEDLARAAKRRALIATARAASAASAEAALRR